MLWLRQTEFFFFIQNNKNKGYLTAVSIPCNSNITSNKLLKVQFCLALNSKISLPLCLSTLNGGKRNAQRGRHDYYVKCSTHFFEMQNQNTLQAWIYLFFRLNDRKDVTSDKMNFRLDIKQNFFLEPLNLDKYVT